MTADVADACRDLVGGVAHAAGRLDILVNNAGITAHKRPEDLDLKEWRRVVMDTNLTSAFLCPQAAYPALCAAGGGKVISIGAMMSLFGAPSRPHTGTARAGSSN